MWVFWRPGGVLGSGSSWGEGDRQQTCTSRERRRRENWRDALCRVRLSHLRTCRALATLTLHLVFTCVVFIIFAPITEEADA